VPLYEVTDDGLVSRPVATFSDLGLYERHDLQRLLRESISVLGEDLLVVAEEFGSWEDSRRRIDLLALDRGGHLVVIELKRDESGGHMDLQAIRYAAMVSSMGFEEVVGAYAAHRARQRLDAKVDVWTEALASQELATFLDAGDSDDAPVISTDVRIILVSADFGREITTTVLWLNRFVGMDIRCVRIVPYDLEGRVLLDVQQVLPLPEAADYQVRLRRKDADRERARTDSRDFTRYHIVVDGEALPAQKKRHAIRTMVEQLAAQGAPLVEILAAMGRMMRVVDGLLHDGDAVRDALTAADDRIALRRWFCDQPLVDEASGKTYVVSNQWGTHTEWTLAFLADQFPDTKVTFRRADSPDE
jgi:hypothetical protein